MNYFSSQIKDQEILTNFHDIWFINRSYNIGNQYKKNINDNDHIIKMVTNGKYLIARIDDHNFLTINNYPFNSLINTSQFIYWTFNNNCHNDVLKELTKIKIITYNTEYMIWCDSQQSNERIKHYYIITRQKIFKHINDIKLKKLIIVARHGPREPIVMLPKLKYFANNDKQSVIDAKLTQHGINYCYNFGKYICSVFGKFFNFDKLRTVLYSSDVERTKHSAIYFYKGIFGDLTDCQQLNELRSRNLLFDSETKLQYVNFINNIQFDYDVKDIRDKLYDITGYHINTPEDFYNVYSTLKVYKEHSIDLPIELTSDIFNQLETIATDFYYVQFYKTIYCEMFAGKLYDFVKNLISKSLINCAYLSTHDTIIYPLALLIANEKVKLPDFCSSVRFELWCNNDLRIYYDDVLIKQYFIEN